MMEVRHSKPDSAAVGSRRSLQWLHRNPLAVVLATLILAFVSAPFDEHFKNGDIPETARLSLILLAAMLAVGERRWVLILGTTLAAPAMAGKWINHYRPDLIPPSVYLGPAILFVVGLLFHLLQFIRRSQKVDSEVVCAGLVVYLLLGLVWSFAYILVGQLTPGAFAFAAESVTSPGMKGFTALYFSFITLCTVGYGDITPTSPLARMLAMTEAITGTLCIAIMIARLVALYSSTTSGESSDEPTKNRSA
jgi:hypothetical protein